MFRWTEERVAVLRSMWGQESASTIAKLIGGGVSRNGVIGKAHRLGLMRRSAHTVDARDSLLAAPRKRKPKVVLQPKKRVKVSAITGAPMLHGLEQLPKEPPPPARPDQDIPRKALLDLEDGDCRWPVTVNEGTRDERHMFCCRKQVPGLSYCAWHLQRATNAWQPKHPSQTIDPFRISSGANAAAKADAMRLANIEEFVAS